MIPLSESHPTLWRRLENAAGMDGFVADMNCDTADSIAGPIQSCTVDVKEHETLLGQARTYAEQRNKQALEAEARCNERYSTGYAEGREDGLQASRDMFNTASEKQTREHERLIEVSKDEWFKLGEAYAKFETLVRVRESINKHKACNPRNCEFNESTGWNCLDMVFIELGLDKKETAGATPSTEGCSGGKCICDGKYHEFRDGPDGRPSQRFAKAWKDIEAEK